MRETIMEKTAEFIPGLKKRARQNNTLLIEELRILAARRGENPDIMPAVLRNPPQEGSKAA